MIPDADHRLVLAAARAFASSDLPDAELRTLPIHPGVSKIHVRRFEVQSGPLALRVVLKPCALPERLTLAALDGIGGVPRAFVPDTRTPGVRDAALLDAGDHHPGFDLRARREVACALSSVHAAFRQRPEALSWLPQLDRAYLDDFIIGRCWAPAWTRALQNARFRETFGALAREVEASAQALPADLLAFHGASGTSTLAHTDVYPDHLRRVGEQVLVIDWGQARFASLFLDLGDTFDTPGHAGLYRGELAARGIVLRDDTFSLGMTLAWRFAGLRYLWWWTEQWTQDAQAWNHAGLTRMLRLATGHP